MTLSWHFVQIKLSNKVLKITIFFHFIFYFRFSNNSCRQWNKRIPKQSGRYQDIMGINFLSKSINVKRWKIWHKFSSSLAKKSWGTHMEKGCCFVLVNSGVFIHFRCTRMILPFHRDLQAVPNRDLFSQEFFAEFRHVVKGTRKEGARKDREATRARALRRMRRGV